jgi:hypothetical protein
MSWFRRDKDEAWRQLSQEVGAEFVPGGLQGGSCVRLEVKSWTITLDFDNPPAGVEDSPCTRLRVPFVNPDRFRFWIWRRNFLSGLGKFLGNKDIATGDPAFDKAFVIQGNDAAKVRDLFASPEIRRMSLALNDLSLTVIDARWLGRGWPDDVAVLVYQEAGVVTDVARLKALFELFAAMLERLWLIGAALKERPEIDG